MADFHSSDCPTQVTEIVTFSAQNGMSSEGRILKIIQDTKIKVTNKKKKTWWCISIIRPAIGVAGSWNPICHLEASKTL